MLSNHIKIAWRHLLKNKFISLINLTGLIVGMTTVLFIWLYVSHERSYDQFHEKSDRIFRVRTDRVENGIPFMQFAAGTAGAGPILKDNLAEIEDFVKLISTGEDVFSAYEGVSIRDDKAYFAMPSLFSIFSFPFIRGNPGNALAEPFTACISESTAMKLFGEEDPVGKTLTMNGKDEYRITGVFADCPENSHIKFNILLSYITFSDVFAKGEPTETSFTWDGFFTYLLLKPGTNWKALENKFPGVIEKVAGVETKNAVSLYLQPLEDIHLYSNYLLEAEVNGDGNAVNFLFLIGIIVLFIAWFNYINLATARSELRAKEIGVRKVTGGDRRNLIKQFLTEAGLLNVIALFGAYLLTIVLNPFFEILVGNQLSSALLSPKLLIASVVILFFGTLLASLYPAFLLSSFEPMTALQARMKITSNDFQHLFRKSLVAIQFVACIGLIACTIIVYKQLNFMQESELGINIDQILVIKGPDVTDSTSSIQYKTLEQELKNIPAVKEVTGSSSVPGQSFGWAAGNVRRVGAPDISESFHVMASEPDYSKMYEMEIVAGRYMSNEMRTDVSACLINETGMKLLQFSDPNEAVGSEIEFWGERFRIVGVLKDFHQESPKSVIEPLIMRVQPDDWVSEYISVKLSTEGLAQTIDDMEAQWRAFFSEDPFEYFFLDAHFNQQYQKDKRFARIFTIFSALAIFVCCLGLFALVSFVVEKRKKEIGIRKALGASEVGVVALLSKVFIKLALIAILFATPIAWHAMNRWLQEFTYRIELQWWIFAVAGLMAVLIAMATVSVQSVRAALANPAKSLRTE